MLKKKISKVLAVTMTVISFMMISPAAANAEWKHDERGWWYAEGNSWYTGWKLIDNDWYYFNSYGYMLNYSMVDDGRYYVGSDGKYKPMTEELSLYSDIIKDNKASIFENTILDIDQDGTYEMLLNNGTCEADRNIKMYKYKDGQLYTDQVPAGHAYVSAYDSKDKKFLVSGGHMGDILYTTYKLENNKLVKVDDISGYDSSDDYTWNGVTVTKEFVQNKLAEEFDEQVCY